MERFLPPLRSAAGLSKGSAADEADESTLKGWYERMIRPGQNPTMQDHILIFAFFLHKVKRQFVFTPDDMKSAFADVGREVPKSLLQIMGSLKRDHNLLWPGDKRGEYCLLPSGIRHVEKLLGIQREEPPEAPDLPEAAPIGVPPAEPEEIPDSMARAKFRSLFSGQVVETSEEPE
ncbi:MAG: hypothetical protein ACYTDY_15620 [Planctomycetota bacterium]